MPTMVIYLVLGLVLICEIILILKAKKTNLKIVNTVMFKTVSVLTAILVITHTGILVTANIHGMTNNDAFTLNTEQVISGICNTPVKDTHLPDKTKGNIAILYKFNCPDCKAVYKDLKTAVGNNKNVYWISSQSKTGKELCEKYDIRNVPTAVYFRQNDYDGNINVVNYYLATEDADENTVLDERNINRILYLQSENR